MTEKCAPAAPGRGDDGGKRGWEEPGRGDDGGERGFEPRDETLAFPEQEKTCCRAREGAASATKNGFE